MTVDLPAPVLARLRAEAAGRGMCIDQVIAELADQLPPDTTPGASPLTTSAMVIAEAAYLLDRELGPQVEALLYQSISYRQLQIDAFTGAD